MKDFLFELKKILLSDISKEALDEELENYHDSDIADVLEELTEEERLKVYDKLSNDILANIFAYYENVEDYIEEVSASKAADIIQEMDSNDALDVLNELDDEDKEEIISLMDDSAKEEVLILDSYDEDEIGSSMSDNYIVVNKNNTIKEATAKTIKMAGEHDNIYTIYAVDDNDEYCGAINIKDLIVARKTDKVSDLIIESYPFFYDKEIKSECINRLKDYSEDSVPILNDRNEIVGVITSDILIDMTEEELTEDYAKLAGLSDEEDIDEGIFSSIKKRIPWLIILLFLGLLVSSVTGVFEGVISSITVIVFFQTVILGMSGNVGTQSLAVTIRNLSNNVSKKDLAKGVLKEIRVGLINGLIVSSISFIFILLYLVLLKKEVVLGNGYIFKDALKVSGIISLSLVLAMTVSNLIGSIFPIILDKMRIDPAVASGPFITTMNDVVAILIYYGLAYIFLL